MYSIFLKIYTTKHNETELFVSGARDTNITACHDNGFYSFMVSFDVSFQLILNYYVQLNNCL